MTEGKHAADTPDQLLAATGELTRRVRKAQRGSWFPLVLLGLVVIAAAPFYRLGTHPHVTCGPLTVTHGPGGGVGVGKTCFVAYGWPTFAYWMVALVLAYVVIAGFYVLKARRHGVGDRIGPYVTAGIAGLILVAALWLGQRDLGRPQLHYQAAFVVQGLNPLLAIGLALVVLAWVERSRALLVFAAGYLAAALLVSFTGIVPRLLRGAGWVVPRQWIFLPGLWLVGALLLLGGVGLAVAERFRP